jgi:hypothetical protein
LKGKSLTLTTCGGGFGAFLSAALVERDGKTICREVMVILSCWTDEPRQRTRKMRRFAMG